MLLLPCAGAIDLLPFHPVGGASMDDAASVSRSVATRLGRDLKLPVMTYGAAHPSGRALRELRKQTAFFRDGGGGAEPDFGPKLASARAGVTVCGASEYVVNFNIALGSTDLAAAARIAKAIRAVSPGGLDGVEAMAYLHAGPHGRRAPAPRQRTRAPAPPAHQRMAPA